MAFSGSQLTRLGLYGGARGLYGSFAGKAAAIISDPDFVLNVRGRISGLALNVRGIINGDAMNVLGRITSTAANVRAIIREGP